MEGRRKKYLLKPTLEVWQYVGSEPVKEKSYSKVTEFLEYSSGRRWWVHVATVMTRVVSKEMPS